MPLRIVATKRTSYGATRGFPEYRQMETAEPQRVLAELRYMASQAPSTLHELQELDSRGVWVTIVTIGSTP